MRVTGLHLHDPQKPIPCALAVVRYTAWMGLSDMETRIDVTETLYEDTLMGLNSSRTTSSMQCTAASTAASIHTMKSRTSRVSKTC